jgi:hypothetical protein
MAVDPVRHVPVIQPSIDQLFDEMFGNRWLSMKIEK